jgi:hypothetical protein
MKFIPLLSFVFLFFTLCLFSYEGTHSFFSLRGKECNEPNCSFDGLCIIRKYERNKAARKSCSVTRQDAHKRYSPYVARLPLRESPWQAKKRLCDSAWQDFMSYTVKPNMTRLLSAESPLSRDCEGLRDRRGSASCSLALSINSRGFCKEKQS